MFKREIQESLDWCALVACTSPIAQPTSDTWLFDPPAKKNIRADDDTVIKIAMQKDNVVTMNADI